MTIPADMIALLEYAHPHIAFKIKTLWGLPECEDYILSIMLPTRINREGFDEPVIQSLIGLQDLHTKLYSETTDIWELYES